MDAVWKFPLLVDSPTTVKAPKGARPLSVGLDGNGTLCVWMMANTDRPAVHVTFNVYGTGEEIKGHPGRFLGSVTTRGGLVWHIFESD
jgi:hypothetical protein